MKKHIVLFVALMWSVLCFSIGGYWFKPKHPLRISSTAIHEINMACSGDYKDLAANRAYVYANCRNGNKPVTIQNYIFK